MALSEEDQRLLAQMEESLAAEDPKLANILRGTGVRKLHRRRATLAGLGFLGGVAMLIGGMQLSLPWNAIVSIAGFVLMLASTLLALKSWRHVNDPGDVARDHAPSSKVSGATKTKVTDREFMDRLEERWRRRQDEGE